MRPPAEPQADLSEPRDVLTCLTLGWSRLRHGRELVGLLWLETFLVALLSLAGLALPLMVVGFEPVRTLASADRYDVQEWLLWLAEDASWRDFVPHSPALVAALAGLFVLWTVALFVYCWFQAGLYGVLVETLPVDSLPVDPMPVDPMPRPEWTSPLDFGRFALYGRRYLWRVFGLLHAFLLYLTGVLCLWVWVVWLVVGGWMAWGVLASLAIGLGGMLPVGWLAVLVGLWFLVSRADVARPGSGVRPAQRRGWKVLRGRPGAVTVLGMLFVALALVAGGLLAPLSLLAGQVLESGSVSWWIVRGSIELASWGLYSALAVFVGATTVAFVQDGAA